MTQDLPPRQEDEADGGTIQEDSADRWLIIIIIIIISTSIKVCRRWMFNARQKGRGGKAQYEVTSEERERRGQKKKGDAPAV